MLLLRISEPSNFLPLDRLSIVFPFNYITYQLCEVNGVPLCHYRLTSFSLDILTGLSCDITAALSYFSILIEVSVPLAGKFR